MLAVPYAYRTQVVRTQVSNGRKLDVEESELVNAVAYFLPDTLSARGGVDPEIRHRGIYEEIVYSTKLKLTGSFLADFTVAGIEADRIDWEKTRVLFGASDLHGVRSVGPLKLGKGRDSVFEPTAGETEALLALAAKVAGVVPGTRIDFSLQAGLQGSDRFEIASVGKTTSVALQSIWADPSFIGAALPIARSVGPAGFNASWESAHFTRGFPQSWSNPRDQQWGHHEKNPRGRFRNPLHPDG